MQLAVVAVLATASSGAAAAAAVLANPPWIQLAGGDCCPGVTNCSTGNGPYAVSTGGDYPATTGPVCDKTPGCIAYGQMQAGENTTAQRSTMNLLENTDGVHRPSRNGSGRTAHPISVLSMSKPLFMLTCARY